MNQHTTLPASSANAIPSRTRAILPKHKWHLLKTLESIKKTFDGSFFLDEAERRRLIPVSRKRLLSGGLKDLEVNFPVRPYPPGTQPRLTLNMIEKRLRGNQYENVDAFRKDVERIVTHSESRWRYDAKRGDEDDEEWDDDDDDDKKSVDNDDQKPDDEHEIIQASRKVLSDIEEAIKNLPTSAPTVSRAEQKAAAPTIDQSAATDITGEKVSALLFKIAHAKKMHENDRIFPCDSRRPMFDLEKLGQDTQQGRYKSFKEIYDVLEQTFDKSQERNGARHRMTLLIYDVLEHVKNILEEAMIEAELLELKEAMEEQMLDALEPPAIPDEPPLRRKELYVKQQQDKYRSRSALNHQKKPRNLVVERILKKTTKIVGTEDEASDDFEDELEASAEEKDEVTERQHKLKDNTKSYTECLPELSEDLPTLDQIYALGEAKMLGPNFLGRTASLTSGKNFGPSNKTNGSTAQDVLLPAAGTDERFGQHARLVDLKQGEIIYMAGHHLAWADLDGDELLSYSTDMLFLIVHALGRFNRGQGGVTVQLLDRHKAKALDGAQGEFYPALDIFTIFELPKWPGWTGQHRIKLHPRKFTHEFLSHGVILCEDSTLKQAALEDLIRDGLFKIFPSFNIPGDHKQVGLYTAQVVYRRIGYPPRFPRIGETEPPIYSYDDCPLVKAMTIELLQTVRKVSLNFRRGEDGLNNIEAEPPLHAFIGFLTFEKRQPADPVFTKWIKQHYTAQHVLDLYTDATKNVNPGFTVVADNLPGVMQYLDLVRDCIEIFDLPRLPPNDVQHAHTFDGAVGRSFKYAVYDNKWNQSYRQSSTPWGSGPGSGSDNAGDENMDDAGEGDISEDDAEDDE